MLKRHFKDPLKMTEFEKQIYNSYLAITRQIKNKPFKKRVNFENFEQTPEYLLVKRLCILFSKHKEIDIKTYFEAPYKIYQDASFFDLGYYSSPRAVKAYTLYRKILNSNNPDDCVDEVKKSLEFLTKFCIESNIQLLDYTKHSSGSIPTWVEHIKRNQIHPYTLMEFTGIYKTLNTLTPEEQEILLGSFASDYFKFRDKYNNSNTLKPLLQKAFFKLQNLIFKRLQIKKENIQYKE